MKIKNNNGFTLLELLVAIFIFTIVIFIGYRIIDKSTVAIKEQGNINKGQMTMNNINDYITKDLEKAKSITLKCIEPDESQSYTVENGDDEKLSYLENSVKGIQERNKILSSKKENKLIYRYTINFSDESKSPSYTVEMSYKRNDSYTQYSIYRSAQGDPNIDFITNYKTKKENDMFELPLTISKNNPYLVKIGYEENLNKSNVYKFEVTSRYISESLSSGGGEGTDGTPINPIPKPPSNIEIPKGYDAIGFWTADKSKCVENLYTWINGELSESGYQDVNKEDSFNIKANNSAHGNSGHTWAKIGYEKEDWKATKDKETTIKPMNINNIFIYVSKNTTLLNVNDSIANIVGIKGVDKVGSGYTLSGGDNGTLYECILGDEKKKSFDLTGILSIDKEKIDSGFAIVLYGSGDIDISKDGLVGDVGKIVIDFIYK